MVRTVNNDGHLMPGEPVAESGPRQVGGQG
jgi:hypothetical protein